MSFTSPKRRKIPREPPDHALAPDASFVPPPPPVSYAHLLQRLNSTTLSVPHKKDELLSFAEFRDPDWDNDRKVQDGADSTVYPTFRQFPQDEQEYYWIQLNVSIPKEGYEEINPDSKWNKRRKVNREKTGKGGRPSRLPAELYVRKSQLKVYLWVFGICQRKKPKSECRKLVPLGTCNRNLRNRRSSDLSETELSQFATVPVSDPRPYICEACNRVLLLESDNVFARNEDNGRRSGQTSHGSPKLVDVWTSTEDLLTYLIPTVIHHSNSVIEDNFVSSEIIHNTNSSNVIPTVSEANTSTATPTAVNETQAEIISPHFNFGIFDSVVCNGVVDGVRTKHTNIEDPAINDPTINDPTIDHPTINDPTIDHTTINDPTINNPTINDPTIDHPTIDHPTIDHPTIDDPTLEDETNNILHETEECSVNNIDLQNVTNGCSVTDSFVGHCLDNCQTIQSETPREPESVKEQCISASKLHRTLQLPVSLQFVNVH
jgi:hypothetical protein